MNRTEWEKAEIQRHLDAGHHTTDITTLSSDREEFLCSCGVKLFGGLKISTKPVYQTPAKKPREIECYIVMYRDDLYVSRSSGNWTLTGYSYYALENRPDADDLESIAESLGVSVTDLSVVQRIIAEFPSKPAAVKFVSSGSETDKLWGLMETLITVLQEKEGGQNG